VTTRHHLALAASLLLLVPRPAPAQFEADSAHVTHGLWKMTIRHPQAGTVYGLIQESDASWQKGMEVYDRAGTREPYLYRFESSGGDSVWGALPPFGSTQHGSVFRVRRSADGTRMVGRWYGQTEDDQGPILLERLRPEMRVHDIVSLEYGALDYTKMLDAWKYAIAPGNLPRIRIDIAGKNLFRNLHPDPWARIAGMHVAVDDSLIIVHVYDGTQRGDSLRVYAWLKPGAKPGRNDLKFSNYEPPADELELKAIKFVRRVGDEYEEIEDGVTHGETFFVEARLGRRPDQDQLVASLNWPRNGKKLTLAAADATGLVFRSAPLVAQMPLPPGTASEPALAVPEPPTDP
jgi:hypothetical protein